MTDLYVYYRVRRDDAARLQAAALAMQASLSHEHGVAAALKRRPEAKDGLHTWMEVYLATPDGFAAHLDHAAHTHLAALIEGKRHMEVFLDCSACA